jgi:hypothetical protein
MSGHPKADSERGVAVLEAAIVLPLLVVLVFGIVDVGRLIYTKMTLHDAAQEGSIYGSYNPGTATDVQDRVVDSMTNLELATDDVVIACPPSTDTIRVTVTKEMTMITPVFAGRSMTLSATEEGTLLTSDVACEPTGGGGGGPVDTDGDGLDDDVEAGMCTLETNPDTEGDGYTDGDEVDAGSDPCDWWSRP